MGLKINFSLIDLILAIIARLNLPSNKETKN